MCRRLPLILVIIFGLAVNTACTPATSPVVISPTTLPLPTATPTAPPHTPTGITIVAVAQPTQRPTAVTSTPRPGSTRIVLQGKVLDTTQHPLAQAIVDWQYAASDRQRENGRLPVSTDGLFRLELSLRPTDELFITAHASGYLPSTARLQGHQLKPAGARLDFHLVADNDPVPTVPGALGTIQLHGIVYNSARGLKVPVVEATLIVVNSSMVQSGMAHEVTTSISGTFTLPLALHSTDQLKITISAAGFVTGTLKKSAQELAQNPQLLIGLRPAPKK